MYPCPYCGEPDAVAEPHYACAMCRQPDLDGYTFIRVIAVPQTPSVQSIAKAIVDEIERRADADETNN